MSLPILTLADTLSACMFFLFLSLALPTKHISLKPQTADVFSIAVHVFRNLFWKICPLFVQILIRFLKCSRASFSPSSHSEKMRWDKVGVSKFLFIYIFRLTINFLGKLSGRFTKTKTLRLVFHFTLNEPIRFFAWSLLRSHFWKWLKIIFLRSLALLTEKCFFMDWYYYDLIILIK